jgi:hypothetical protein
MHHRNLSITSHILFRLCTPFIKICFNIIFPLEQSVLIFALCRIISHYLPQSEAQYNTSSHAGYLSQGLTKPPPPKTISLEKHIKKEFITASFFGLVTDISVCSWGVSLHFDIFNWKEVWVNLYFWRFGLIYFVVCLTLSSINAGSFLVSDW